MEGLVLLSCVEPKAGQGERIDLIYWMNSLQPIRQDDPLFATLNASRPIREDLIHDVTTFHHPVFDMAALAAQNTWFCGAWMRKGLHEDGFASEVDVVQVMGARQGAWLAA